MAEWPVLNAARNHGVIDFDRRSGWVLSWRPEVVRDALLQMKMLPWNLNSVEPLSDSLVLNDVPRTAPPSDLTWNEFSYLRKKPMAVVAQTDLDRTSVALSTIALSDNGRATLLGTVLGKFVDGYMELGDPFKCAVNLDLVKRVGLPELGQGSITEVLSGPTLVVLFAWALLECRNVEAVEIHPSTRLEKAKTDPTRVVYRELVVKPAPGSRRPGEPARKDARGTALHIVRGHFKEYDEKPLFGRLKGRWFWPSHVAGNQDYGTVLKSYSLDPGRRDG